MKASDSASRRRSPSFSTRKRASESPTDALHKGGGHPPPLMLRGKSRELSEVARPVRGPFGRRGAVGLHRAGHRAVSYRGRCGRRALWLRPGGVLDRGSAALSTDLDFVSGGFGG